MNAKPEGKVMSGLRAIDNEFIWPVDNVAIAIAGDIPHQQLFALFNVFASKLDILISRAPHVGQRGLPTNDFRNHRRNQ